MGDTEGADGDWYSTSFKGFVVTEWSSVFTRASQGRSTEQKKIGKTRNLKPDEIVKVELKMHGSDGPGWTVEAIPAFDGSSHYIATWSRPKGMRSLTAEVVVKYKAYHCTLETPPLKVS